MARTPAQFDADQKLTEAIEGVIAAYELRSDENEHLFEYVVVAHTKSLEMLDNDQSGYVNISRDNGVSTHTAVGLLNMGLHYLMKD